MTRNNSFESEKTQQKIITKVFQTFNNLKEEIKEKDQTIKEYEKKLREINEKYQTLLSTGKSSETTSNVSKKKSKSFEKKKFRKIHKNK